MQTKWRTRKEGIDEIYKKAEELKGNYGNNYEIMSEKLQEWYSALSKNDKSWQHRHYNKIDQKGVYFPGDIFLARWWWSQVRNLAPRY